MSMSFFPRIQATYIERTDCGPCSSDFSWCLQKVLAGQQRINSEHQLSDMQITQWNFPPFEATKKPINGSFPSQKHDLISSNNSPWIKRLFVVEKLTIDQATIDHCWQSWNSGISTTGGFGAEVNVMALCAFGVPLKDAGGRLGLASWLGTPGGWPW